MPNFEDQTVRAGSQSGARNNAAYASGQILAAKYKVISLLGSGGMGTVYRVEQIFLNIELALKVLDGKHDLNESQMRRFTVEAKAAYSLNHPSLVKVHDFGLLENGQPYLVMDLVAGKTLADHIKEFGPMPLQTACEVFVQAAEGLNYAHQQSVIHRDIKPSNIMLLKGAAPGTPGSVKIVDFGIAKIVGEDIGEVQALTRTGEIFGSPLYMSPEQCSGELIDHRTDIYSLGCAFFETLTGTPPHIGVNSLRTMMLHKTESAPRLRDASLGVDFPESIELVIHQMLAKSPHERYENLEVAARDIARVVTGGEKEPSSDTKRKTRLGPTSTAQKPSTLIRARAEAKTKSKIIKLSASLGILTIATAAATIIFNQIDKFNRRDDNVKVAPPESAEARKAKIEAESPFLQASNSMNDRAFKNREQNRIAYAKAAPINEVLITEGGVKLRQINFPKLAIGQIEFEHQGTSKIEARNIIKLPAEGHLQLVMGGSYAGAFETTAVMKKIAPNIFDGLAFETPELLLDSESTNSERETRDTRHMNDMLVSAAEWTKLKQLVINSIILDKFTVQTIAKFKHLEELQILNVRGSEIELAEQPLLRKLRFLKLNRVAGTDIFKTISSSTALTTLQLESCDLEDKDFKLISKCPNLNSLIISKDKITENEITDLVNMKKLKTITLIDVPMASRQVQNLLKSKNLKLLTLLGSSKECLLANPVNDQRLKYGDLSRATIFKRFE